LNTVPRFFCFCSGLTFKKSGLDSDGLGSAACFYGYKAGPDSELLSMELLTTDAVEEDD